MLCVKVIYLFIDKSFQHISAYEIPEKFQIPDFLPTQNPRTKEIHL